jgi:VCBS repeat-containing protein
MAIINGNNSNNNIVGTNNDDIITDGNGNDVIAGLAGNDSITAGNGNNTISDGDGNDTITAGNGINTINVGNGNDTVTAGNNNNTIVAGGGTDNITVGNGSNTIVAGGGADTIHAGNGGNSISAGAGNDVITTGSGRDTIDGGAGNDRVSAGGGNDLVIYNMSENVGATDVYDGGRGTDTLRLELTHAQYVSAAVQADLAAYNAFLAQHANSHTVNGPTFHFTAFDLSVSNFENVNIVIVNAPVVITSGPESASVVELANTTGSAAVDTTTTVPAGTLNFTDADTGDTHTVAVTLGSTSGPAVPAATQADLAAALTTTLHDSTGTGTGNVDWNFNIADKDLDFLAAGETETINYHVQVSDGSSTATQTVSVVVTGANDAVTVTSGPQSGSVAEQAGVNGSTSLDQTSPVPTGTLAFTDVDLSDAHSVGVAVSSVATSDGGPIPDSTLADLQAALLTTLNDSTGTGNGGVDWSFAIQDKDLDFLGAGVTLTVSYDVTVSDGFTSSTQTVTITATGAADPLVVNPVTADAFDSAATDTGNVIAAGNVITDVGDNSDSGISLFVSDVNGQASNVGASVAGAHGNLHLFSDGSYIYEANANLDPLQVGDNPTDQFNFTVSDSLGRSQTTTLTFNVVGADDAPTITGGTTLGSMTEDAGPSIFVNGGFETGDLSGWTTTGSSIQTQFLGLGGELGNWAAQLSQPGGIGTETISQTVATTPGQHYFVSFYVTGDPESVHNSFLASWDGAQILSLTDVQSGAFTHYTFDVVGDPSLSSTTLEFTYNDDGNTLFLDQVSVSPASGPATESSSGSISFTDAETGDTHSASFSPQDSGYVGTFTLDPVTESSGSGSLAWHFTVDNSAIQFLAQGQVLTQDYLVSVTDNHGLSAVQDVTITINGTNDAPTAVNENVITDVGPNGTVDIPAWALGANDTDPDTTDHVSANNVVTSTGGNAVSSGDVFFTDDATPGGSFTYTSSDGIATSANAATATVINNATTATSLTGTSGDDVLIATNGTESLSGGGGNDVLIGNNGSHVMTGGSGNDNFAFLNSSNGQMIITDFNNTTEHDHIAVSANGVGGGLTAGMDVTPIFETSGDDQFQGIGKFHFDTANQTLYFSPDGTTASAISVAQVQAGVTINPHDLLIV